MPIHGKVIALVLLVLAVAAAHADRSRIDAMPTGRIAVDGQTFDVRIARTPVHRAAGFQHVEPERMSGEAIHFRYDPPRRPSFHMRNVARPLLLAWIAPDGRVLQVIRMHPESEGHLAPGRVGAALEYPEDHPLAELVRSGVRISRVGGD